MTLTGIDEEQQKKKKKLEKHIEKQIGCMAGFLQIFIRSRHHHHSSTTTLSSANASPEQTDKEIGSPAPAASPVKELECESKAVLTRSLASWKFSRETPRLSLDSRAVVEVKGGGDKAAQRHSISTSPVIARLMGLDDDSVPMPKLQRSASDSRLSRDHLLLDSNTPRGNAGLDKHNVHPPPLPLKQRTQKKKRSTAFYDPADFFPEMKDTVSLYQLIERRLRLRGINHPSHHILQALQLKGLLHSEKPYYYQSPPLRSSATLHRTRNQSPPPRSPSLSRHADQSISARNSSPNRRKVVLENVETQRRRVRNEGDGDSKRVSPVHSPKISSSSSTRNAAGNDGSPRMRRAIDNNNNTKVKKSTFSRNSFNNSSHADTVVVCMQRYNKSEEYREGRNLLDRCDMLVNRIAEITAELQPSPVSVLDSSSIYKDVDVDDDCCTSPSPITKRYIDYKDQAAESEDDTWGPALGSSEGKSEEDCDFAYVSQILRACCSYLPEERDIFMLLEKRQQRFKGMDTTSKALRLHRRLVFDTLQEILNRNKKLPPWTAASRGKMKHLILSEFRRLREREEPSSSSEDLFGVIDRVLKKDMAEEDCECPVVEMGDVVLDIERLVFKDLIGETIRHLASSVPHYNKLTALRRKLVF